MHRRKGETSYRETAFGIIPRSKLIPLEIKGIKLAWDFIVKEHTKGQINITPGFIKKMHLIGFGWIFPEFGGKYRNIEVVVSKHNPPKFYLVPQLMSDFCKDIEVRSFHLPSINESNFIEELIELLAWMHHRFLWIHPFQDYNGRISRLLINIVMLNLDLPPIELKVETKEGRNQYVQALQKADDGNYLYLQKLIKAALEEAARNII